MQTDEITCRRDNCGATFPAKFIKIAEQHFAEHRRLDRRAAERFAADQACRAAYGPPRRLV